MDISAELQAQNALLAGGRAPRVEYTTDIAKARKVAVDFEAFMLGQMLQPMFEGIELEEPFGGGLSEQMFRSMQVDEYGKMIARNGGIGIADAVMGEILKLQEGRA